MSAILDPDPRNYRVSADEDGVLVLECPHPACDWRAADSGVAYLLGLLDVAEKHSRTAHAAVTR